MRKPGFKKIGVILFLIMAVALAGAGCAGKVPAKTEKAVINDKIQIGITFDNFILERWLRERDMFVYTARRLGAEVDVRNANGDVNKQIQQIESFIQQGKDVIVIIAADCYRLENIVNRARAEGIKIISYDRMIQCGEADLYITVDSEMVGQEMAQVVIDRLPQGGNVVMICGPDSDANSKAIIKGFETTLADAEVKIVQKISVKAWTPEFGFQAANEVLQDYSDINAVMCGNDGLAGYVIQALSERQMAGQVVVTGQDADLEACQRIMEGTQTMTVYKPIEDLAAQAAEFAVMMGKGEKLNIKGTMKSEEGLSIPYYGLEPIAVTAENMDQVIIKSGFHLKEDVYRNVAK